MSRNRGFRRESGRELCRTVRHQPRTTHPFPMMCKSTWSFDRFLLRECASQSLATYLIALEHCPQHFLSGPARGGARTTAGQTVRWRCWLRRQSRNGQSPVAGWRSWNSRHPRRRWVCVVPNSWPDSECAKLQVDTPSLTLWTMSIRKHLQLERGQSTEC